MAGIWRKININKGALDFKNMAINKINQLYKDGLTSKQKAIDKVNNYKYFIKASRQFSQAYDLLNKEQFDVLDENINKDLLLCLYKYEKLDCDFSFEIKKKRYTLAQNLNKEQYILVNNILEKYSSDELPNDYLKSLYSNFKYLNLTNKFHGYFPIAISYFDQKKYYLALENFKLSRIALEKIDISKLSIERLDIYNRNKIIICVNISMSLIGIERNEAKFAEKYLYIYILKQLLFCLDEANKIIGITNDIYYQNGKDVIIKNIKYVLKKKEDLWSDFFNEFNGNAVLIRYAQEINNTQYNQIISTIITSPEITRKLLFVVHGFNTRGAWKNRLVELIDADEIKGNCKFIQIPWDYDSFGYLKFVTPFCRNLVYNKFQNLYFNKVVLYSEDVNSTVIVAHSFGTRITSYCMTINNKIQFHKMIFLGSILRRDFDWKILYDKKQIKQVLVEVNKKDWVLLIAKIYSFLPWVNWIGNAGQKAFNKPYPYIEEKFGNETHSSMLNDNNMRNYWIPFLKN
jgi:hypothetical protein